MKRVAPDPWLLSLRNAQTIEPTTAWTAVSSPAPLVFTLEWSGGGRPIGEQW